MMVRTSMDVDIYNVSIHGWANNEYRTTSCLPSIFIIPYLLKFLFQAAYPTYPKFRKTMHHTFAGGSPWHWLLQGRQTHSIPKCLPGKKKPRVQFWTEMYDGKPRLWTYFVPIAVSIF